MHSFELIVSMLMASLPAVVWGYIFYKKDPVYAPKAVQTFLLGMSSVLPILLYKWSWDYLPFINIFNYTDTFQNDIISSSLLYLPLGSVFAFMFVGIIEEYMKHIVVKKADQGFFRNIDDAIEFSIIAALGFAFIENILYFYYIWEYHDTQVLLISFVFRSVFSTFAHILFSGIYGYYYGIAYFADPIWAEEQRAKRHPITNFLHMILHMKRNRVFCHEMATKGLLLAVLLHAFFNIMLEMNITFFMIPFLTSGYMYLSHLFKMKENLKAYGYLVGEESDAHVHQLRWNKLNS